jgi:hypothetical protein
VYTVFPNPNSNVNVPVTNEYKMKFFSSYEFTFSSEIKKQVLFLHSKDKINKLDIYFIVIWSFSVGICTFTATTVNTRKYCLKRKTIFILVNF